MTEKKLYKMVNSNLVDDDGGVYYFIKKGEVDICQVFGKITAKLIVDELNALNDENKQLKQRVKQLEDNILTKLEIICGEPND